MRTAAVALLLASCASPTYIKPPGITQETFERTLAHCRVQSAMIPAEPSQAAGDQLFHAAIVMKTTENCMRAEGFTKR